MVVFITGGAGMIGSHCAEYFVKRKHKVIVYDSLIRSKIFSSPKKSVEYNWLYLKNFPNIVRIKKDIRDRKSLEDAFRRYKPDIVIHTAAQPGVRFSLDNPWQDSQINCLGTVNVLEATRKYSPKGVFIYCSTNKVYGDNINSIPLIEKKTRYVFKKIKGVNEHMPIDLGGHTPYGVSKLCGDLYAQDYAYTYGLKAGIFRMSCIYGERQFGFEDQGWLAWFTIRFLQGKPITIYGDGKQMRDVLWVDDLIKAFSNFIKSDCQGEVFNIGGGVKNTISLLELISLLEEFTSRKVRVEFKDWRPFDQKVYVSDISKARKILNWEPRISVREGIMRLLKWVKKNSVLFE